MSALFGPLCLGLLSIAGAFGAEPKVYLVAPTEPQSAAEQQKQFHLPPGFEIQLVAAEPEVPKPINLNFDPQGRLLVTQSIEYPFGAPAGSTPRDTIKLIVDSNGDGVPDKVTTFADGLNIPIGVTPIADGVLGYSIPSVYRFLDKDGDGRADQRELAYEKFGFTDTHGMASSFNWWLDGWIYACHGFSNTSTVRGQDGQSITMQSGNTYRLRQDGSHIEYFTHGQVNPFGLTFDTLGDPFTSDCHSKPIYMMLRGAYYPSFGKPHDGLGFGPEMIAHTHHSTGICGVAFYGADNFPPEYRDTMLICNPVTGRVNHDRLETHGSSYNAVELPDFVTCDDPWFRPVDAKLAPDGSLYIADFYNRIIGHYEVPLTHPQRDRERGRIWRIVATGDKAKPHAKAPDLTKLSTDELIVRLGDSNIVLRTFAVHQLVHRIGPGAIVPLQKLMAGSSNPLQRAMGLWALTRLGALHSGLIRQLSADPDRVVRVHLARALASHPLWTPQNAALQKQAIDLLGDSDVFVRRAAAAALGQHADPANLRPLLDLWVRTPSDDTHLIHVVRISLRDNLEAFGDYLKVVEPLRADAGAWHRVAEISLGIRSPHAAEFLLAYLQSPNPDAGRVPQLLQHALRTIDQDEGPKVYRLALESFLNGSDGQQVAVLRGLQGAAQERGWTLPADVRGKAVDVALRLLRSGSADGVRAGLDFARDAKLTEAVDPIVDLAQRDAKWEVFRQPALTVLVALDGKRALPLLKQFLESTDDEMKVRQKVAELLGNLNTAESRKELIDQLRVAPEQLALAIARALSASREGADGLLQAASDGKASARLLQDATVSGRLGSSQVPNLKERLDKLLADLPPEDERVLKLMAARSSGFGNATTEAARGVELFGKHCAGCHRVNGKGGKIGPDLDGVGLRGLQRLLEDTLTPSRNVDQAFRSSALALVDGKSLVGLVLREEGEVVVMANDEGKEIRIPKGDIEERRAMTLSPMPANVAELIPERDYYDLLAYLLSLKASPEKKSE